jgi:basic membrane protein A and related proteins
MLFGSGCKRKTRQAAEQTETDTPEPKRFTVGVIYGGPKTDSFNQPHAAAAAALAKLPDIKLLEEENVVSKSASLTLEKLAVFDHADLIFDTSFGHFDPAMIESALKHPKVTFLHCGGLYQEGKHPPNLGSFNGYLDEAFYVAGVAAGLTSKHGRLGFIAAKPLPHVLRDLNAFTLGARSVNPAATTTVVFTNYWSFGRAEERAANELIDKQIDVLAAYVSTPRIILETAERRGVYSVGVHVNGAEYAPKGYLTGAEWNWNRIYADYVNWVRAGKSFPRVVRGGLAEGYVTISPFGPVVSDRAKEKALEARAKLAEGKLTIFRGPLKSNRGQVVLTAGKEMIQHDIQLEMMSYLVEGVVGALPD